MHTLTLVTVELPEIEEEPMVDLAIQNLLEECNIKKKKLPNNFMLDMHIEELNNRQNAFSRAVETEIETIMEPYGQNSEEFYVFEDYTEELKAEYENGAADCIKLSNGKIVSLYQYPLYGNFIIKDGLVYKKQFGQLKHEKRNKQAKKMTALPNLPYKKRYKTLGEFAEDAKGMEYDEESDGYGYWYNPNAFWDWYSIGGRWPRMFLVKEDCKDYSVGERSWTCRDSEFKAPEGYKWTAAARKKDIEWKVMHDWRVKCETEYFFQFENAFKTGDYPKDWHIQITDNKILRFGEVMYIKDETLEHYLRRNNLYEKYKYPDIASAYLHQGECHDRYDYWQSVKSRKKYNRMQRRRNRIWRRQLDSLIDSLSDDTVLVGVDCHM